MNAGTLVWRTSRSTVTLTMDDDGRLCLQVTRGRRVVAFDVSPDDQPLNTKETWNEPPAHRAASKGEG